jgi:Domain of unknown function (DUF5060)
MSWGFVYLGIWLFVAVECAFRIFSRLLILFFVIMNRPTLPFLYFAFSAPLAGALMAQAPLIRAVSPVSASVGQYEKFETTLDLSASYSNPYDYSDVWVKATFTGPDGQVRTVDGFFVQEYELTDAQTGSIAPKGAGVFKIRFAPTRPGSWSYTVSCATAAGTATFPAQTFQCTPPADGHNKGFVRAGQSNYLHFDNGAPYVPIGKNLCWQQNNPYVNYRDWLGKMRDHGANFFRLWQCHWGLGLEWRNNGYQGLLRYRQDNAFYLDWLLDFAAANGLYAQVCLQHHGQVSTKVNPNWGENPYNAANGGPCAATLDFFGHAEARKMTKNRLRYLLARWGYARSIMAWELFNEVDWTDDYAANKNAVADWHADMAAFLKQNDPNKRLVTTSFAEESHDPAVWNAPDIDYTQTHFYVKSSNPERTLAAGTARYLGQYDKPTLNGEFSIDGLGPVVGSADPDGIHLHNGLWASLFGGGMGSAMTWWWDNYFDPKNLYYHYAPLAAVSQKIPLHTGRFVPATSKVSGAPSELSLIPAQGWGAASDTAVVIGPDGRILPAGAALGQYLYGSTWNTEYRRPPVFYVEYPVSGTFSVKTSSMTGTKPKIAVWIDGVKKLEQDA